MTESKAPGPTLKVRRSLGVGLGLAGLLFILETLPLLPGPPFLRGPGLAMILGATFFIFLLFAGLALPYYLPYLLFSRERRAWAARQSLLCIALVAGVLAGYLGSMPVRRARFAAATIRALPLIEVIEAHHKATGHWPEKLESLIPSRISELPSTGMVAYPAFSYRTSDGDDPFKTYELAIHCPSGGINFDVFVYWPEQGYPDHMYGGWVERIGDWGYVHE